MWTFVSYQVLHGLSFMALMSVLLPQYQDSCRYKAAKRLSCFLLFARHRNLQLFAPRFLSDLVWAYARMEYRPPDALLDGIIKVSALSTLLIIKWLPMASSPSLQCRQAWDHWLHPCSAGCLPPLVMWGIIHLWAVSGPQAWLTTSTHLVEGCLLQALGDNAVSLLPGPDVAQLLWAYSLFG